MKHMFYRNTAKPFLARLFAALGIVFIWPVMLLISVLIKLDSPGKVLFIQKRIGKDGEIFNIYKFRSMQETEDEERTNMTDTYEDDPRITRVGKLIRKTSLDELPQLFNILEGTMCFIGPRPLLPDYPVTYEEYQEEYKLRFLALPGMFCLVDTKYRAKASFDLQCLLDVEYVEKMSFWLDIKIFFLTFRMVLMRKNIYK